MPSALTVPRVLERVFHRLGEAVVAGLGEGERSLPQLSDSKDRGRVAFWISATTRWPAIREDLTSTLEALRQDMMTRPSDYDDATFSVAWPLPAPIQAFIDRWPDTKSFFNSQRDTQRASRKHVASHYMMLFDTFQVMDARFRSLGL
jgi:hypothetical protein